MSSLIKITSLIFVVLVLGAIVYFALTPVTITPTPLVIPVTL